MLDLGLDEKAGVVRAVVTGVLTTAEADRFKTELTRLAVDARRRCGRFLLVADTAQAPVQPQDVIVRLPTPDELIAGPTDRWAVTVSSTLARMQADRLLAHPQAKAFLSVEEAEQWATQV